jgi:hypothetical protein
MRHRKREFHSLAPVLVVACGTANRKFDKAAASGGLGYRFGV